MWPKSMCEMFKGDICMHRGPHTYELRTFCPSMISSFSYPYCFICLPSFQAWDKGCGRHGPTVYGKVCYGSVVQVKPIFIGATLGNVRWALY